MNINNDPIIGIKDPGFNTAPADATYTTTHIYNPGVIQSDSNVITQNGSGPIVATPFIGTHDTEINTPPSLLKPILLGTAALVALNFLT